MQSKDLQEILGAYAVAMTLPYRVVRDAGQLPFPKERIKEALLTAMSLLPDNAQRGTLRAAFVQLADWQYLDTVDLAEAMQAESKILFYELRQSGFA